MSSDCPALMRPITITAANHHLDFEFPNGSAEYNAAITVGEYADIYALITEIKTAMHTASAAAHPNDYSSAHFGVEPVILDTSSNLLKVSFYTESSLHLRWSTGTTGNTIGAVLGFDVSADDTIGAMGYITGDYQATCCWASTRPPARDTKLAKALVAGKQQRSLSGTMIKQVCIGTHSNRRVEFVELPKEIMWAEYATAANTNRDLETFWAAARPGQMISYYPDQTLTTHAHYYMREPTDWLDDIKRPHIDIETYNFTLDLAYHGAS